MVLLPKASFATPTRLLPVPGLDVKTGHDGADVYLARDSWAYHHIATATNIAFALLWAAEGRTALQVAAYRLVQSWRQQQEQPPQRDTSLTAGGKEQQLPPAAARPGLPVNLPGVGNSVDFFLQKCHQTFPRVEMGSPGNGDMAQAILGPWETILGTFEPHRWGVIILNQEKIDTALRKAQLDPATEQAETNKVVYYLAVALARALCTLFLPYLDGNTGNVTCHEVNNGTNSNNNNDAVNDLGRAWERELFGGRHVVSDDFCPAYTGLMIGRPAVLALRRTGEDGDDVDVAVDDQEVTRFTSIPPDFSHVRKNKSRPIPRRRV